MAYRIMTYVSLIAFFYNTSFDALAKSVRQKRVGTNIGSQARKPRVSEKKKSLPSANNKYRTVQEERKLRDALYNYYKGRSLEDVALDFETDYDTSLKVYKKDNPGSNPEKDIQIIIDDFLKSKRELKIPGVKDIEKEASLYLSSEMKKVLAETKISMINVVRNLQGRIDLKTLIQIKDEALLEFIPQNSLRQSNEFKKTIVLMMKLLNAEREYKKLALDLSARPVSDSGRLLVAESDVFTRDPDYLEQTNPEYYYSDEYEEEFITPIGMQESIDLTKAAESKGIVSAGNEERTKRNQGRLLMLMGMTMITIGIVLARSPEPSTQKQGYLLIAGGVMLMYLGMMKLGEAAAIKDERMTQAAKNKEIDSARERLLDIEGKRKDYKEKQIKWREHQRRLRELEEMNRRQQLQDAASGVR